MTPGEIARGLSKAQREALRLVGETKLTALRPGHNLWPETIVEHFRGPIEGTDIDCLHRLGLADAVAAKAPGFIGKHDDPDIGEVFAEWDWFLTPLGLAVRAILEQESRGE
jgi:hypothetical protein